MAVCSEGVGLVVVPDLDLYPGTSALSAATAHVVYTNSSGRHFPLGRSGDYHRIAFSGISCHYPQIATSRPLLMSHFISML